MSSSPMSALDWERPGPQRRSGPYCRPHSARVGVRPLKADLGFTVRVRFSIFER